MRVEAMAQKAQLDRKASAEMATQISPNGLVGFWAIVDTGQTSGASALELYPQRIFFGEHEFEKGVFGQVESKGRYIVDKKDGSSWSVRFLFPDHNAAHAVVQWLRNDDVKLLFADSDNSLLLRRVNSSPVSPFHAGEKATKQDKSSSSDGKSPVGLEPVDP
jgi:hypothetical protein